MEKTTDPIQLFTALSLLGETTYILNLHTRNVSRTIQSSRLPSSTPVMYSIATILDNLVTDLETQRRSIIRILAALTNPKNDP